MILRSLLRLILPIILRLWGVRTPLGVSLGTEVLGAFLSFRFNLVQVCACVCVGVTWGKAAASVNTCVLGITLFCSLASASQVWSWKSLHSPEPGLGSSALITPFPAGGHWLAFLHST